MFFYCGFAAGVSTPSIEYLAKVNDITQDERGFIWLSGHQGLTRFDSVNSITFSANDPNWQVPFSWAHELEPYGNRYIVSTENNGSWLFNPITGDIEQLNIQTEKNSHYHTVEFNGKFYVYSTLKVYQYDIATDVTTAIFDTSGTSYFVKTSDNLYLKNSADGLFILEGDTFTQISSARSRQIASVNNLLVNVTNDRLETYDGPDLVQSTVIFDTVSALAKEHATDNFFTIADSGNIEKYHAPTLTKQPHDYGSARKGRVKAAFHDSSNVLWLAGNLGVETLVESAIKNHPIVFDVTYNSNELTTFKNELVIGSYGQGLHSFSPKSTLFPDDINQQLSAKAMRVMHVLSVGDKLYIATFDGVWQYDLTTQVAERLPFPNNDKILLRLFYLDGLLFIGTNSHGLTIFDTIKNVVVDSVSKEDGLISNEIIDIIAFEEGNVWLATSNGASIYNQYTKTIKNMPGQGPGKFISLAHAENKIFAATLGDGIYIYDLQGTLLSITAKGIEFAYSSVIGNELWIGAAMGLYIVNPVTHQYSMLPGTERYSFSGETHVINDKAYASHYSGILEIPTKKPAPYDANVFISKNIVSGNQKLSTGRIDINSPNDVITLELASLDFRPGQQKQFKYKINNGNWNNVNGSQLTLTGLAPGDYQIEVMATNSIGQWSSHRAFANVKVAYPWYWTLKMRVLWAVILACVVSLIAWILYLRTASIRKVHLLLEAEFQQKGKRAMLARRNIQQTLNFLASGEVENAKELLQQNLADVSQDSEEPDNLYGKSLLVALPYFADYLQHKYHVKLNCEIYSKADELNYELQSNLYKIIYEAITCAILHGDGRSFNITLQEFNHKLWLTITDDESSFANFNNKITFNMSMYYIRQIANKYSATVNTFEPSDEKGSQVVLSFPLNTY